ncbi:hypothetical protein D3C71_1520600 [compost metagenome]
MEYLASLAQVSDIRIVSRSIWRQLHGTPFVCSTSISSAVTRYDSVLNSAGQRLILGSLEMRARHLRPRNHFRVRFRFPAPACAIDNPGIKRCSELLAHISEDVPLYCSPPIYAFCNVIAHSACHSPLYLRFRAPVDILRYGE